MPALKQRNTQAEKAAIKEGRVPEAWQAKPAKLRQKGRDARWRVMYTKAKVKDGADAKAFKPIDLAISMFGYKNHIAIDPAHGMIRAREVLLPGLRDDHAVPAPFHVLLRCWAGPSFLAMLLFEKYGEHQPLNRQAERLAREGVPTAAANIQGRISPPGQASFRPMPMAATASSMLRAGNLA